MNVITLEALERETGKKGARATRRADLVPCVLYGHGTDAVSFAVPTLSLRDLIYTDESHVVEVKMNSNAWKCILKEVIFHPVTDKPQHADFQVLIDNEPIKMTIPVRPIGIPVGQIQGGLARLVRRSLEIMCLPRDIPEQIDLQVGDLKIGQAIQISDLEIEGVTFLGMPEQTIYAVTPPRGLTAEEEEEAAEAEEGEEGDEGEEGEEEEEA